MAERASVATVGETFDVGQKVTVMSRVGTVRFFGTTEFAAGTWVGIELAEAVGKNDGNVKGVAYFTCKPNHGIFVRPAQCVAVVEETSAPAAAAAPPASPSKRASAVSAAPAAATPAAAPAASKGVDVAAGQVAALRTEIAQLEKDGAALTAEISGTKTKETAALDEIKRLEEQTAAAIKDAACAKAKGEELKKETEDTAKQTEVDSSEQASLDAEKEALQNETRELEQDKENEIPADGAQGTSKPIDPAMQKLRRQIDVERNKRDLAELHKEEISLKIEELNETKALSDDIWTEEKQLEWHKEALMNLYEDHRNEMRRLKLKATKLERAEAKRQEAEEAGQNKELESLQRNVEQLRNAADSLEGNVKTVENGVDERRQLKKALDDNSRENLELETALSEELNIANQRARQLETVARQLVRSREDIKRKGLTQKAEAERLEIRLQALRAARDTSSGGSHGNLGAAELEAAKVEAEGRASGVRAQVWAACLPDKLRDEAELGTSFQTLCALHACLYKAQILSRCVHEYYIADAALAVLQEGGAPMHWLCRACLASAQLAYGASGFLGRLQMANLDRYKKIIRNPAVSACANGEHALDLALNALLGMLRDAAGIGSRSRSGGRNLLQDALSAMSAQSAQLLSLQGVFFKDESFASWQGACCAVEALRAACASALYASDDAGGKNRMKWQRLYEKANRLARHLGKEHRRQAAFGENTQASFYAGGFLGVDLAEGWQRRQKRAEEKAAAAALAAAEGADAEGEEAQGEEDAEVEDIADDGALQQDLLERLLREVAALEAASALEPTEDHASDALSKALVNADAHLDTLNEVFKNREKPPDISELPTPPWVILRDEQKLIVQDAEGKAPELKNAAEQSLASVAKELDLVESSLSKEKEQVSGIEKEYCTARIGAEHFGLAQSAVSRIQTQLETGVKHRKDLEYQLAQEKTAVQEIEQVTGETKKKCRELEQQIKECEKRLEKKFSALVPIEDVKALRRTCVRQEKEIASLQQQRALGLSLGLSATVDANETHSGKLATCWKDFRSAQVELLLEQASTPLVHIEAGSKAHAAEKENHRAAAAQRHKLEGIAHKSGALYSNFNDLLCDAVALPGANAVPTKGGSQFTAVAVTRFMKATALAAQQKPVIVVGVPIAKGDALFDSVVGFADLGQIQSMHHSLL